jgi:hypothetical protein
MVVVTIIGLLATLAAPGFERVRLSANANRIVNDLRIFRGAFETHSLESGGWAPDGSGNKLPETVRPYVDESAWTSSPIQGVRFDWEQDRLGFTACIALVFEHNMPELFIMIDSRLDDGNFVSGDFLRAGDRYLYILER